MSSAAAVLEYEPQPLDNARPEKQGVIAWIRSHIWALNDQVLISGANFATGVLTARALDKGEFGTFSIIYAILLLANIFQSTLITQAHNVLGATRIGQDYRRYTSSTAFAQLFMVAIEAMLALAVALVARTSGWASAGMLLALIPAIVCWQFQEFIRRVLYTESRHGAALCTDIITYGGQTAAMAVLYMAHRSWNWPFTGATALYILAGACAAGTILGIWQIRRSIGGYFASHDLTENWHFGKWLLGGELMGYCSSLHAQVLWAAWLLGTAASADLRAVGILFGPTRVIAFFLGTVLPIRFARTLHANGIKAMTAQMRSVYAVLVPVVGLYCLLLVLFPRQLLRLAFHSQYDNADAVSILTLYSICAFLTYLQMVVAAGLTAARQTRYIFVGSVWGCIIALIMSPLFIHFLGANGSIVSIIVTTLVVTALFVRAYRKQLHPSDAAAASVDRDDSDALPAVAEGEVDPRGELLERVIALFEKEKVPYCVLHGYEALPKRIHSDVDCLIPRNMLARPLAKLLRANQHKLGADVVQWFNDGAHFVVLATHAHNGDAQAMLQLHISGDFVVSDRVVFKGSEILRTRRQLANGLWIPAAEVEFAAVLANRLNKGKIKPSHARQLSQLWAEDATGCREQLDRLLPPAESALVALAAQSGDWATVIQSIDSLGDSLRSGLTQRQRMRLAMRWTGRQLRRAFRWIHPRCGLHVVFLGPDGVGKSTVIDAVRDRVSPAFLHTHYQTFARGILPTKPKASPHALPPRSKPASLIKAAWWLGCYSLGYYKKVHPTLARGGLAINHRYLIDAIVDPHRYRYSASTKLIRWIWAVVPKPDLIIFLDAPTEVICARKQEMPADTLARLREGYLALAATLPNAHVVSTDQAVERTIEDVSEIILNHMAQRIARRSKLS